MSGGADARADWIKRVLGVDVAALQGPGLEGEGARKPGAGWTAARQAWASATEAVDQQIGAFQRVLRESGDPELVEIAEFGLGAITGGYKTKLIAALIELGDTEPATVPDKARKALGLVQSLRSEIGNDPRVDACDTNPSQVRVAIKQTLFPALDALAASLA